LPAPRCRVGPRARAHLGPPPAGRLSLTASSPRPSVGFAAFSVFCRAHFWEGFGEGLPLRVRVPSTPPPRAASVRQLLLRPPDRGSWVLRRFVPRRDSRPAAQAATAPPTGVARRRRGWNFR
jgi:hypothetical protein